MTMTRNARSSKLYRLAIARGANRERIPADRIRKHLNVFVTAGYSNSAIARATGASHSSIAWILAGKTEHSVERRIALPILAITHASLIAACGDKDLVPILGTRRRVQALMTRGWRLVDIKERYGVNLRAGLYERETVAAGTHRAVVRAYDDLWDLDGPSTLTARRAVSAGYAPPMAWDDSSIDDPAARPQGVGGALKGRRAQVVEDCEVIAADGGTLQAAAQRLGMHQSNLTRALYRAGRADLVAALTRQARGEDAPGGTRGVARSRRARAS